ncbi:MAG: hypothetical protein LKJ88_00450 [Bacilli bacterium]|jgi:hypothetical protein|nr:hypothetical protein [Bacilli bacterium]
MKYQLSNMYIPSDNVKSFIDKYVEPKINIHEINDENIEDVIEFIADNYENPLSQEKHLSASSKKLLNSASCVITELSSKAYK